MLRHETKHRETLLAGVTLHDTDGTGRTIRKVLTCDAAGERMIWPERPYKIRVRSSLDASKAKKIAEGQQYGYPVADPIDAPTVALTVTPYPATAGWYVELVNLDGITIPDVTPGELQFGSKVLQVPVPSSVEVGEHLHKVIIRPAGYDPEQPDAAPAEFCFWTVKLSESTLRPIWHWSFDDDNLVDKIGGVTLANTAISAPTFSRDNAVRYAALQSNRVDGAASQDFTAPLDFNIENGASISFFIHGYRFAKVGFCEADKNAQAGNHFGIELSYGAPVGWLPYDAPALTTSRLWSASDKNFHHLALTMSARITAPLTYPGFTRNAADNGFIFTSTETSYTMTLSDSDLSGRHVYHYKIYSDGVLIKELVAGVTNWRFTESNPLHQPGGGVFRILLIGPEETSDPAKQQIDELKVFSSTLTLADIRSECALIGLDFGGGGNSKPPAMDTKGRLREGKPDDFTAIPLKSHLKAFVLDDRTVAVAGEFHDFWVERLGIEWPTSLYAEEYNYKFVMPGAWTRNAKYKYCMWELYNDYQPLIVARYDNPAYFKFDGAAVELAGRWQNSNMQSKFPDLYDGTDIAFGQVAEIIHFAYLKLPEPMAEGSSHSITDGDGNSVTFTYDRAMPARTIKVNQSGYLPECNAKYAYFGQWLGSGGAYVHHLENLGFQIVPADGTAAVFTGNMTLRGGAGGATKDTTAKNGVTMKLNGELTYELDFSAFSTPGRYQIYIPGVGYSHPFTIGGAAIGTMFWTHMRGMFHQRSGIAKAPPCTHWEYPMPVHRWTWEGDFISNISDYGACQDAQGNVYNDGAGNTHFRMIANNRTGEVFRDIYGGWFDAADFDRRPHHANCVNDMAMAYLLFPQNFTDNQLNLPESGDGIPDILSEAMWGIDLWLRAQRPDGGISMWVETIQHESDWPWRSNLEYCLAKANRSESLSYACYASRLARALRLAGTPAALEKAAIYTESAIRAFKWGINPGNNCKLEFSEGGTLWAYNESQRFIDPWIIRAAVSLFTLTRDPRYAAYVTPENYELHYSSISSDENTFTHYFMPELWFDVRRHWPELAEREEAFLRKKADQWLGYQEKQTYRCLNWAPDHAFYTFLGWGAAHPESRGRSFIYMWKLTGDLKWRDAALNAMDWATGCNGMGRSLTSGLGSTYPVWFLHHWLPRASVELGVFEAPPGITPYAHKGLQSDSIGYVYLLNFPARADMNFAGVSKNIFPASSGAAGIGTLGQAAQYMEQNWPLWRQYNEIEGYTVTASEFTVAETISGKAFMAGCLMGAGFVPDPALAARTPATDRFAVDGYVFLP